MDPLALSSVSRPRFQTVSMYDDVYRETGRQYRSRLSRFEHLSYLELPLGPGRGGMGFEFSHLATDARLSTHPDEEIYLGWRIQRFAAGVGQHLGSRLMAGGCIGLDHLAGIWLPAASLALAIQPHRAVSLVARAGQRPDMRMVDWAAEGELYRLEVKHWHSWWAADMELDLSPGVRISAGYKRNRTTAPDRWYRRDGFGLNPKVSAEGVRAAVHLYPTDGIHLVLRCRMLAADGSGRVFYSHEEMGNLTGFDLDETDVELGGTYRFAALSRVTLFYENYRATSSQKGHLELWPFSEAIFGQMLRLYFLGSGEARVDRLVAGYTRSTGAGEDWTFQVGYVWMKPDFELRQRKTTLIIFGEIVQSYLRFTHAEFLVPEARKSFALGGLTLTYAFAQAIPTRIRLRERPPPVEPPEKKRKARGGGFHLLEVSYAW